MRPRPACRRDSLWKGADGPGPACRRDGLWKGADGVSGLAFCGCCNKLPQTGVRGRGRGVLMRQKWAVSGSGGRESGIKGPAELLELSGRVPHRLVSGGSGCALSASAPPSARPLPSVSSVHLLKGCWLLTSEPTLNPGRSSQLQILHQTCKDSLQIRSRDRTPGVKMWTQTLQPSFTPTQWCPENALPLIFQIQPPSL